MNIFSAIKYSLITLFFIFLCSSVSAQTIRYVKAGAAGTGSSWANASGDLQAMINASDSNSQVWVAKGTYTASTYFSMKGGVKIYGGFFGNEVNLSSRNWLTNPTILAAVNNYTINNPAGLTIATLLDGFTFTGGANTTYYIIYNNAGSSPGIVNCVFTNNNCAGVILNNTGSSPNISNCSFTGNTASSGVIANSNGSPHILNSYFNYNNYSGSGTSNGAGAINNSGTYNYVINNCVFKSNKGVGAGAIFASYDSNGVINNCTFIGNIATTINFTGGGGISITNSRLKISNCLFSRDTGYYAGGLFINNSSTDSITNCVFSRNVSTFGGGGVRISSNSTGIITNCTFYKNAGATGQGGGVNHPSSGVTTKIYNSIFWGNTKGGDSTIGGSDLNGPAYVSNCLLQLQGKGNYNTYDTLSDNNIFQTDPAFVNPLGLGDTSSTESLKLKVTSPCVDEGDNSFLPPNDTVDIAGASRVQGDFVDMGAYETTYSATADGLHLSFADTYVCPASPTALPSYVDIPLTVSNFNLLLSLQGSISWDTSVLKFNSVSSVYPNIGLSSNNFNSSTSGNLLFSWYDNDLTGKSVPDLNALFTIRFDVDPKGFGKNTALKIGNYPISLEAVQYPQKNLTVSHQSGTISLSAAPSTISSLFTGCGSVVYKGIVYNNAVVFHDTLRTIHGCDSVYTIITIQPQHKLAISASSNSPLNIGDTLKLNVVGETPANASVTWSGPNSFTSSLFNPIIPNATGANAGVYTLNAVNACGSSSVNTTVAINAPVTGRIITPLKQPIKNVSLLNNNVVVGNYSGSYQYQTALTSPAVLRLSKNNDINKNNGVSSIDILLIQSHILQKQLLNDPYKLIAADVNSSGSVTSLDLVYIKRLILGLDTTYPGNKLWAFVDSSYKFPVVTNPFPYKDSIYLDQNSSVLNNQTFIGVKLGDVDYDWDPALLRPETATDIQLYYNNINVDNNSNEIRIPLLVKGFNNMVALQYTLNFNKNVLAFAGVANSSLSNLQFADNHKNEGVVSFLWSDDNLLSHTLPDGAKIIELVFTKKVPFTQEDISITSDVTKVEAWDNNFVKHNIVKAAGKILAAPIAYVEGWSVFPNPAKGNVKINYNVLQSKAVRFQLLDAQGKIIATQTMQLSIGSGQVDFNLNQSGKLAAGEYYIKAIGIKNNGIKKLTVTN